MVIGEAGYLFAFHSDTVARQSRNWQARFRRMNNLLPCSVVPTRCWNRPRLSTMADIVAIAESISGIAPNNHAKLIQSGSNFEARSRWGCI